MISNTHVTQGRNRNGKMFLKSFTNGKRNIKQQAIEIQDGRLMEREKCLDIR